MTKEEIITKRKKFIEDYAKENSTAFSLPSFHGLCNGLSYGIDIAIGFAFWISDNCEDYGNNIWLYNYRKHTSDSLFDIYLETLKTK